VPFPTGWRRLSTNHRRNVRIAQKAGVTVSIADELQDMRVAAAMFQIHYRRLGVPFFGWRYFAAIWEHLIRARLATLLLAKLEGRPIGAHLLFFSGSMLISKYCAAARGSDKGALNCSYLLNWEAIQLAAARGFARVNLGVTGRLNRGLLDFKNRFGAETRELYFYHYAPGGSFPDFEKLYASNRLLQRAWALMPGALTTRLGHRIASWYC